MTNYEKYHDKFMELALKNFGIIEASKEFELCSEMCCEECLLKGELDCNKAMEEWLNKKYEEIDWAKVEVDTPIYVSNKKDSEWDNRYFAKYENGKVYSWIGGKTSFTAGSNEYAPWEYAKLAEVKK